MQQRHFDVAIVGGGLIGLSCALECANRGLKVALITETRPGIASTAAAGMLAPTIEPAPGVAGVFAQRSFAMYSGFLAAAEDRGGASVPNAMNGLLELVTPEDLISPAAAHDSVSLVTPSELQRLEPHLRFAPDRWALFHPNGGWVDNVALVSALSLALRRSTPSVEVIDGEVEEIARQSESAAVTIRGDSLRILAANIVLAAGAWSPIIRGLPRALPLEPVRGQMLSVSGARPNHVLIGKEGYAVPRAGQVSVLGSTMERKGFAVETTDAGINSIRGSAREMSSSFTQCTEIARWAGLRPITPDALPILGREPHWPSLIYACGHGRNGVLLSAITSMCIADIASGAGPREDLSLFRPDRW